MNSLQGFSTPRLHARLEEIEQELLRREPALFTEMMLVQLALKQRTNEPRRQYAGFRQIGEAIFACLDSVGMAITKKQIFEELEAGGYPLDPRHGRHTVNDAINYYVSKGILVPFNGQSGVEMIVGRAALEDSFAPSSRNPAGRVPGGEAICESTRHEGAARSPWR